MGRVAHGRDREGWHGYEEIIIMNSFSDST